MINTVTVTNDYGESIVLDLFDPYSSGLAIREIQGLGPVNANINTTDYASKDGALFNGARQETRNIVFDLVFLDSNVSIEQVRHLTYKYFPNKRKITIRIETDTRTLETDGYVESNEPTIWAEDYEGCQISVICESSYFRSPNLSIVKLSSIIDSFHFPFASTEEPELTFGYLNVDHNITATNTGDVAIGVEFELVVYKKIINPIIYNYSTGEMFGVNMTLLPNDVLIITTDIGNKTATLKRGNTTTNVINYIREDISWLELLVGDNTFVMDYTPCTDLEGLPLAVAEFDCQTSAESIHNGLVGLSAGIVSETAVNSITISQSGEDTSEAETTTVSWADNEDIPSVTNGRFLWYQGTAAVVDDNGDTHILPNSVTLKGTLVGTNKVWVNTGNILELSYQDPVGTQATLNIKYHNKYLGI